MKKRIVALATILALGLTNAVGTFAAGVETSSESTVCGEGYFKLVNTTVNSAAIKETYKGFFDGNEVTICFSKFFNGRLSGYQKIEVKLGDATYSDEIFYSILVLIQAKGSCWLTFDKYTNEFSQVLKEWAENHRWNLFDDTEDPTSKFAGYWLDPPSENQN